jgi:hypothetical protein
VYFIITDVHTSSRETYITDKVRLIALSVLGEDSVSGTDFVQRQAKALLGSSDRPSIALMDEHEFYAVDQRQEAEIDVAKRCALMELVHSAPLVEGEEIVEDFFTYLKEPFQDFSRNTGVLRRRTNMADLLYIFDHVQILDGNIAYRQIKPGESVSEAVPTGVPVLTSKIGDLVKDLLGKAAGAGGGKIGAMIFNLVIKEIFGTDDNAKFIEAVQQVVREEIESDQIDKINGRVQGTIQYLTNEYQVRKSKSDLSKPQERRELLESLSQYSQNFYTEVMGVLELPRYAEKGLRSYLLGSSIHLVITQEQALVDWKTTNPNDSSYATTLKINAKHYREHVETTFDTMVNNRLAKIKWGHMPDMICDRVGCHISRDAWGWGDEVTHDGQKFYNDQHKKGLSAKEMAENAANAQKTKVYGQMAENAGDPRNNALPDLKKLETMRIPV